jgi:hypothetical protein
LLRRWRILLRWWRILLRWWCVLLLLLHLLDLRLLLGELLLHSGLLARLGGILLLRGPALLLAMLYRAGRSGEDRRPDRDTGNLPSWPSSHHSGSPLALDLASIINGGVP